MQISVYRYESVMVLRFNFERDHNPNTIYFLFLRPPGVHRHSDDLFFSAYFWYLFFSRNFKQKQNKKDHLTIYLFPMPPPSKAANGMSILFSFNVSGIKFIVVFCQWR